MPFIEWSLSFVCGASRGGSRPLSCIVAWTCRLWEHVVVLVPSVVSVRVPALPTYDFLARLRVEGFGPNYQSTIPTLCATPLSSVSLILMSGPGPRGLVGLLATRSSFFRRGQVFAVLGILRMWSSELSGLVCCLDSLRSERRTRRAFV